MGRNGLGHDVNVGQEAVEDEVCVAAREWQGRLVGRVRTQAHAPASPLLSYIGGPSRPIIICCADIGSVANKRFGWAAHSGEPDREGLSGTDTGEFAQFVADKLAIEEKGTLGFECPLWIPIANEPSRLTQARQGEGDRAWSAAAGSAVLTTGLVQVAWILDRIRRQSNDTKAFLDWRSFQRSQSGLFIGEAFVTGGAKASSHEADATAAVTAFRRALGHPEPKSAVEPKYRTRSLIGAALLWTGWFTDIQLLQESCLVIRA